MNRLETVSKISVYEVDGEDVKIGSEMLLAIESHWSDEQKVVLNIDNKKLTVFARDLHSAISKCAE